MNQDIFILPARHTQYCIFFHGIDDEVHLSDLLRVLTPQPRLNRKTLCASAHFLRMQHFPYLYANLQYARWATSSLPAPC